MVVRAWALALARCCQRTAMKERRNEKLKQARQACKAVCEGKGRTGKMDPSDEFSLCQQGKVANITMAIREKTMVMMLVGDEVELVDSVLRTG